MNDLIKAFAVMLKNTHRHPANRTLHAFGMPLYILGLGSIIGHVAGYNTDLVQGALFWLAGVTAFAIGHKIEGNLRAITPILASRLIVRKVRDYLVADRIHVKVA